MGQPAQRRMTIDEYVAFEESGTERHEFLDGRVFAVGGGTDAHDGLSTAVAAELRAALRGSACAARGPNLRLKSTKTGLYTYADAVVVCSPQFEDEKRTTLLNPRVVIEVLSESSEAYDRGDKFAHYRSIESIGDYALITTTAPVVEVFSRGADAWELRVYRRSEMVYLPSVDVRISVDAIFEGVDLDPPWLRPVVV